MRPFQLCRQAAIVALVAGMMSGCAPAMSEFSPSTVAEGRQSPGQTASAIQTVFIVLMENHNWAQIVDSSSARYINGQLLPQASYTSEYYNPTAIHPSLPNYLWLEAGTGFGITDDALPSVHHQATSDHLATLLENAGISWKTYQEGITGFDCPLTVRGRYAPKHNPFVYFDDLTDTIDPRSPHCIQNVRPYPELADDLASGNVARYNFITPDQCHDMHDSSGCETPDSILNGDLWLSREIPQILASDAFTNGGALFITWDEGAPGDGPIGMIVLSPFAVGGGYQNSIRYTHSSTLRTFQEIFAVSPLLGDAAKATSLSDLFATYP
jgi:hypothetical protein